jgi:TonB family protein
MAGQQILRLPTVCLSRLLFTGFASTPEYETLKSETQSGAVEHNGWMGLEAENLLFGEVPGAQKAIEPATTMVNNLPASETESPSAAASPADGCDLDAAFGKALKDPPIWTGLYENIRDIFFPPHFPPLELTSTPIPVPDRMAVKRNPWAVGISASVNIAVLLVALFFMGKKIIETVNQQQLHVTDVDVGDFKAPKADSMAGGGGGGGDNSIVDPNKGKLPKFEKDPVVPPQVQTVDKPKIAMEAAIDVQKNITLPDNPLMTNIGVKSGVNVVLSNGQGTGGGMGTGSGGGMGSGTGNGYGPGYGGNTGGGLYHVGGGVSAPIQLNQVEAEFSDEARRAKYQGVCLISMIVDAQGNPQNPRVIRTLGMGLDEKALEAVRKYKFRPAMKDGKTPVPVMVTVEVNFRLY